MPATIPDTDPAISDITATRDPATGRVTIVLDPLAASAAHDLLDGLDLHDYACNPGSYGLYDQDGADQSAAGSALRTALTVR